VATCVDGDDCRAGYVCGDPDQDGRTECFPDFAAEQDSCPCFGVAELDEIAADASGDPFCAVDQEAGGTTLTAYISVHPTHRLGADALFNAALPGSQLACEFGCLDDEPFNDIDDCAALPALARRFNITPQQHALCRDLIAARCP
jgi:hypothetical protein